MSSSAVVVGALCEDIVRTPSYRRTGIGGSSYYFSAAFAALGGRAACVAKARRKRFIEELERAGVETDGIGYGSPTCFELVYRGGKRTLRLIRRSSKIGPDDIPERMLAFDALHIGPVEQELKPSIWAMPKDFSLVSLDIQGLVREASPRTGIVRNRTGIDAVVRRAIESVDVVKFGRAEAEAALGNEAGWGDAAADLGGPRTMIVTLGARGALLFEGGKSHQIPAYPSHPVDWTGAGDCFMAGFVWRRLQGFDGVQAAKFGSALAAILIERPRPARFPSELEVAERMRLGERAE